MIAFEPALLDVILDALEQGRHVVAEAASERERGAFIAALELRAGGAIALERLNVRVAEERPWGAVRAR